MANSKQPNYENECSGNFAYFLLAIALVASAIISTPDNALSDVKRIGLSFPLTGKAAAYGEALKNGVLLFEEERPLHSRSFQFVLEDSRYEGANVVSSIRKLADADRVALIFVWGAMPSEVAAPVAEQMKMPLFTFTFDPLSKDKRYVATFQSPLERYRDVLVDFVRDQKLESIGILTANIGASLRFVDVLRPALPKVTFEEVVADDLTDFGSIISRARQHKIDGLILMVYPEQSLMYARKAAAQRFFPKIIGTDMLADDELRSQMTALIGPVSYIYGKVTDDFRDRYRKRFGNTSHLYEAATSYSVGLVLEQIAHKLRPGAGAEFIASLPGEKISAPIGVIEFNSNAEQGVHAEWLPMVYSPPAQTMPRFEAREDAPDRP